MKKQKETIQVTMSYYKSEFDDKKNIYYGGIEEPKHLDELAIDTYEDEVFDEETDNFIKSGKLQIVLSGSNKALEELGKYLITLSKYESQDPDYHDHFDNIRDSNGDESINLIVRKRD